MGPQPNGAGVEGSFLSGAFYLLEGFRDTHRVGPESLIAEVTLADGRRMFFRGFWIEHVPNVPGCCMVHGAPAFSKEGLVVREDHLISIRFMLGEPTGEGPAPFEFAAGVKS